ncbi:protein neuralized isoform X2 [Lingula anatina]|uniref:RING-type E3 ubiquitin transferase n=1 Tax=Lingula anatina TaxID=7574 RepID=A0A1S3KE31_LINAN|nr:protein neuralized isoform X2 [Lingula anatina]|eukprot:XP_013420757.1 protein neuralized isoform X2 [Lingula anatina]
MDCILRIYLDIQSDIVMPHKRFHPFCGMQVFTQLEGSSRYILGNLSAVHWRSYTMLHGRVNKHVCGAMSHGIADCRQMMQTEGRYSSDLVPPFNNLNVTPPAQHSPQPIHAQQNHNQLVLRQQQQQHVLPPPQPARPAAPPPVRFHRDVRFTPLPFHTMSGKNVCLSSDRSLAFRPSDEYCNAYVFTSKPLRCGEKIVIQILGIDRTYVGGLAFGLTACDPSALTPSELPDDSDLLLDRPEYWVVNKDVCSLAELGDELSFTMSSEGEVYYGRNGRHIAVLMHVDKTLPLWAFFDVYGNTQKIKMLGLAGPTIPRPVRSESAGGSSRSSSSSGLTVALPRENSAPMLPPRNPILPPQRSTSASAEMSTPPHVEPRRPIRPPLSPEPLIPLSVAPAPPTPQQVADGVMDMPSHNPPPLPERSMSTDSSRDRTEDDDYNPNECTVCYENPVDSVLYKCGHMCMCYNCAYDVVNQQGSLCPICRQPIVDVVKIYRS